MLFPHGFSIHLTNYPLFLQEYSTFALFPHSRSLLPIDPPHEISTIPRWIQYFRAFPSFSITFTDRSNSRNIHYSLRNTVLPRFAPIHLTEYPLFLKEYSTFVLLRSFAHYGSCFLIDKYRLFHFYDHIHLTDHASWLTNTVLFHFCDHIHITYHASWSTNKVLIRFCDHIHITDHASWSTNTVLFHFCDQIHITDHVLIDKYSTFPLLTVLSPHSASVTIKRQVPSFDDPPFSTYDPPHGLSTSPAGLHVHFCDEFIATNRSTSLLSFVSDRYFLATKHCNAHTHIASVTVKRQVHSCADPPLSTYDPPDGAELQVHFRDEVLQR